MGESKKLVINVENDETNLSKGVKVVDPFFEKVIQKLDEKNIKISSTPGSRQQSLQPQFFYKNKMPISVSSKNLGVK